MEKNQLLAKALEATAEEYPNSVVGDLLMLFPHEVVMTLLVTFAGEQIVFPKLDVIWRSYRNRVIFNALSARNTKEIRTRLGLTFGLAEDKVAKIFFYEKTKRNRVHKGTLERSAKRMYQGNLEILMKDVKQSLYEKSREE